MAYSYNESERFAETSGLAYPQVIPHSSQAPAARADTWSVTTTPSVKGKYAVLATSSAASSSNGIADPNAERWPSNGGSDQQQWAQTPFLPQYSPPATYHAPLHQGPPIHLPEPDEYYGPQAGEYYKSCYASQYHVPLHASTYRTDASPATASKFKALRSKKNICGLPSKLFWVVLGCVVASIIVIAVVLGIVLGIDANKEKVQPKSAPLSKKHLGFDMRLDSGICAINWTEPSGGIRHAVFTQDVNGSLQLSVREDAKSWSRYNVSKTLEQAGKPIKIRPRSPLAAVASGPPWHTFKVHLYYVDADTNQIQEISTTDVAYEEWERGTLSNSSNDPSREAGTGTQLGAV